MKKIIFGSASAILAVIGFSSFKSTKATDSTYYWFKLGTNLLPVAETNPSFTAIGGKANYLGHKEQTALSQSCTESTDLCIIGYTLTAISGFTAGGTPTGFNTTGGIGGQADPWATRGGVAQD